MRKVHITGVVIVLVAVLVIGCREKPEPGKKGPDAPGRKVARMPQPPDGMTVLSCASSGPGKQAFFFIDLKPVTNRGFKVFYDKILAHMPKAWEQGDYPAEEADQAVVVPSLEAAADYAAWAGKRLPTVEEWAAAEEIVGRKTYPYADAAAGSFMIYCALDADKQVGPVKQRDVVAEYVAVMKNKVLKAAERVVALEAQYRAATARLNPADMRKRFSELGKLHSDADELEVNVQGLQKMSKVIEDILIEKAQLIGAHAAKITGDAMVQKEKKYVEYLSDQQSGCEKAAKVLESRAEKLSKETERLSNALNQRFKNIGAPVATPKVPDPLPEDMANLIGIEYSLLEAEKKLESRLNEVEKVSDMLAALEKEQGTVAEETAKLKAQMKAITGSIEKEKEKLTRASKFIGKEFIEEDLLLRSAERLVRLSGKLGSLMKKEDRLKKMHGN